VETVLEPQRWEAVLELMSILVSVLVLDIRRSSATCTSLSFPSMRISYT